MSRGYLELIARVLLGALFLWSGIDKVVAYGATAAYMQAYGVPALLLPLAIALQLVAPMMIFVGWQTRLAALALAGFSVLAAVAFHTDFSDRSQLIMFMQNVTIAGGLLLLYRHGPGEISIEGRLRGGRRTGDSS